LTLTATVTSTGGTPTGNVTFYDGATNLGTSALVSGVATLATSSLAIGPHTLTASYTGATGFLPSNSSSVAETITKAATSLGLGSSQNPAALGASVTFTATVTATVGTPAGSVTFLDGASPLGTVALTGGVATLTTSALTGGSHTINASYAGNATYAASSNSLVQSITTGSTIEFNPTLYWKLEDGGNVTLTVTRTGGNTTGAASVQYATVAGTAAAGVRYTHTTGTVNFLANETSKTFTVALVDGSGIEGKQIFTVVLSNPVAGTLGASTATVEVMDDDTARVDFSYPLDGKNDLLWRNEITGDTKAWTMNGTTFIASTDLLQFGGNWRLQGAADFNGDGSADLLYRNAVDFSTVIWYMSGTGMLSTNSIPVITDAAWKISAIGDMNGDGYPDIIWRNSTTFSMVVWIMKDNVRLSIYSLPSITDANWQVKGLGDFNNDGQLDIVWRNPGTTAAAIWYMTPGGATRASVGTITPTAGAPWDVVGVGDFNNDGHADMLWQASTTRTLAIWIMNMATRTSVAVPPTINDANWNIAAPR
ncbi:MAG TPA: Ig-like domain repeat protein, partial [Thermoanaerobaculia bacterium]